MEIPDWFNPPDDTATFMYPAWASCLRWAIGCNDMLKEFETETGVSRPDFPETGLDALIDEATGHNPAEEFFRAFVPWFNKNVWGTMEGEISVEE